MIQAEARSKAALGLLPKGVDLMALYAGVDEMVLGAYYPETDEMIIVADENPDDLNALEEVAYFHESVHALQDRHLGLGEIIEGHGAWTDDAGLAYLSLIEGDATQAEFDYFADNPMLLGRYTILAAEKIENTDRFDQTPPALLIELYFPYTVGPLFVGALRDAGGWEAVNAAYQDLPTSTEQILHPEKYLKRDDPTAVTLPDLGPALGAGWSVVDEDTLGELQTAVLLANPDQGQGMGVLAGQLDLPESATNAAAGWDGDSYALWTNGEQEILVWRSVWDSEEEAIAFSRALQARDEERFGGIYEGEVPTEVALVTDGQTARIDQAGPEIFYVLAPTRELADQAMAAVHPA